MENIPRMHDVPISHIQFRYLPTQDIYTKQAMLKVIGIDYGIAAEIESQWVFWTKILPDLKKRNITV